MSGYAVKEIFLTLQGEGGHTGRAAVFCRFSGCNLWSGQDADRAHAKCAFCDTDFVGMNGTLGGRYQAAEDLADAIEQTWRGGAVQRLCVLTGGEPLLQVDERLIEELHSRRFEVAVETNGTVKPPSGIDWMCVSPKAGAELRVRAGDELKLVFPQADAPPEIFETLDFQRFSLQPMDGDALLENTAAAIEYCKTNPVWRLSAQTHKQLGIR